MSARAKILTTVCFTAAAALSALTAGGSATIIEKRSRDMTRLAMEVAGHSWVDVQADGLQVILLGTAPSEAERFRAITRAGTVVDPSRIVDNTDVENGAPVAAPEFSLEMLRNSDGVSLIGLVPGSTDREALVASLRGTAGGTAVIDMLETADFPQPPGWDTALDFAMQTIKTLPRARISVDAGAVTVQAISDSPADKARIETALARRRPPNLKLTSEISAPRPVITPFTLRFLIDADGARFDACSADTERARDRILAAALAAGATGAQGCTIGMGTPSPQWADAVTMGLKALKDLGAGTITYSDADIVISAADTVDHAAFDKVVGELESNLPEVFSLKADLQAKPETNTATPEFSATLGRDGKVQLRGRVPDQRVRETAESFAKARFGAQSVYGATRIDDTLPPGWPVRMLAALDALDTLEEGTVMVTPDLIRVTGVTGDQQASDTVSRLFAQRLGESARLSLNIRYDRRLDPVLGLPTGDECVDRLNAVLTKHKITFEPSSAIIDQAASETIDGLATSMKDCEDYRIEIAGHTDSQGRDETNLRLSQERAQAVLAALQERRVLVGNMTASGYGKTQPIADNGTEDGREANRRIEFVLLDAAPLGDGAPPPRPVAPAAPTETVPVPPPAADAPPPNGDIHLDGQPDGAPMDGGEDDAGPGNAAPAVADPAPPSADGSPGEQIDIPVGDAAQSPALPQPRPEGLIPSQ